MGDSHVVPTHNNISQIYWLSTIKNLTKDINLFNKTLMALNESHSPNSFHFPIFFPSSGKDREWVSVCVRICVHNRPLNQPKIVQWINRKLWRKSMNKHTRTSSHVENAEGANNQITEHHSLLFRLRTDSVAFTFTFTFTFTFELEQWQLVHNSRIAWNASEKEGTNWMSEWEKNQNDWNRIMCVFYSGMRVRFFFFLCAVIVLCPPPIQQSLFIYAVEIRFPPYAF